MPITYNLETSRQIVQLKTAGLSSRKIAKQLGISKSGVNDLLNRVSFATKSPLDTYLFLDIETAPDISATFGRFKTNISSSQVIKEGGWIISIAWAWGLTGEIQSNKLTSDEAINANDTRLLYVLYDLFEDANVVIAHNGDNFDIPSIRARCVIQNVPAFKKVKTIDTLRKARQMRFKSNKLDDLCKTLGIGTKVDTGGIETWIKCTQGNELALESIAKYNEHDIHLLREFYLRIRGYDLNAVNANLFNDEEQLACPVCASPNVELTGNSVYTAVSKFNEYFCADCGARHKTRVATNTTSKRKQLLM